MDDAPTLEQLKAELTDVTLQVHLAEERKDERDLVTAAHAGVERLSQRYRALIASLSPGEQLSVERALGRRVVDLKRLASLLPKVPGASTGSTPDRAAGGGAPEGRRITGVSWTHERGAPKAALGVGADVESWCGRCGELTTHSIVAMVGSDPKQVLCQVCGSRHSHRTAAARRTATGASPTSGGETEERGRPVDPEAKRKAAELRALGEEVAASTEVRLFDPRERYKAGEIISHPEYGRGKIQNVLRSSLLVRFSVGGLKSLMLR
ncbi:MAG TPA: hypothetical protein VLC06_27655 [Polyangia bacterium]|nr:hypothetical protein [Polyangia bacterium]